MSTHYSVETIRQFERELADTGLLRPPRIERYEPGTRLAYQVTGVTDAANTARVSFVIDKFVGGGFAGQVYRVTIRDVEILSGSPIAGLEPGSVCALKILIPPSGFSRFFRNALYWVGFQGPFQLQVNPVAARAGALWQKFIRRGAGIRFGTERSVVDIHATLIDDRLGSCGELSEWVDGRTWRLEVDDRMDLLRRWIKGRKVDQQKLGSPEYRAKRLFMREFVDLLHDMGGTEFARQYEWSTCKSQPNCLKRTDSETDPAEGLTAVDFRAGLALLPFLPMSPGDILLIGRGLGRGSFVQFDRGDVEKLVSFTNDNKNQFRDMDPMLEELRSAEKVYRNSVPDISHNRTRLLWSRELWSTMLSSAVTGWKVRNLVDERWERTLRESRFLTVVFYLLGALPFLGSFLRKLWARPDWRTHYGRMVSNFDYLKRTVKAKVLEKTIQWHRSGRLDIGHAEQVRTELRRILYHAPLSILPAGLHRFLTDRAFAREKLDYLFIRPVRLYFNAELREEWLRDMVAEGREEHLLNGKDAEEILSQIKEPYIQKYLKSLAVHVCTLPVTQIVSVMVAIFYVAMHPELPRAQAWAIGLGIIAIFQVIPISPGSLVRGFYVVYLVIRERNFRDYNIAVFLSFFKYIGYLAFPIQMGYRYPTLAQFMAAHWATDAVHIVPVFGERGALLEHSVFCLFYNWPLTIRRGIEQRSRKRKELGTRYWHAVVCVLAGASLFVMEDRLYLSNAGYLPSLVDIWWFVLIVPSVCGGLVTLGSGGVSFSRRIIAAALSGAFIGILSAVLPVVLGYAVDVSAGALAAGSLWRGFIFTILSTITALLFELRPPDPVPDQ